MPKPRVLFFGSYDEGPGYPRARGLKQALEAWGVEVQCLNTPLLPPRGKRIRVLENPLLWPKMAWKLWRGGVALKKELRAYLAANHVDAILVPYPGYLAVRWARKAFDGALLLDLFLSLYDTAVCDRKLFSKGGVMDKLLRWLDKSACKYADRVILDTPENAEFMQELTGLDSDRFFFAPIGDPDAPAEPFPYPRRKAYEPLNIIYLGTGVPLHGIDVLLGACARVNNVHLTFVGGTAYDRQTARSLGHGKVTVIEDWLGVNRLHRLFAEHHAVFGIFGESDKALRVVPFKLVHALSGGRPCVTSDSSAVKTLLDPGMDCYTSPIGDQVGLARILQGMVENPAICERVGSKARQSYERMFSPKAVGKRLLFALESIAGPSWAPEELASEEAVLVPESALAGK